MTQKEFDNLNVGDVIQHLGSGDGYVIIAVRMNHGKRTYEAVRSIQVSNPPEWKVVRKGE